MDTLFFPIDTIKTRAQSQAGFFPSGGFSGVYRGLGSAVVGSAPGGVSIRDPQQAALANQAVTSCNVLSELRIPQNFVTKSISWFTGRGAGTNFTYDVC